MGLWSRLRNTFRGDRLSAEIREELQFHLEMDAAEGRDSREARLRLGNLTKLEEETRATGVVEWLESAMRDVCYAVRQVRRTPALMLAVVLSLSIGVGANTAIFSLVDAALLKPLPVQDPDSLVIIEWTSEGFPAGAENVNGEYRPIAGGRYQGSSVPAHLYRELAREQSAFQALVGLGAEPDAVAAVVDGSAAEQVSVQYVSSNYFEALGRVPVVGRSFRDADDVVGQEPVVIVSHRFWMSHLGGGRDVLVRSLRVNNVHARVVGVAPPGFFGLRAGQWPELYAPLATKVAFQAGPAGGARGENDRDWWVRQVGRLKPSVPEATARAELAGLFRRLAAPEGATVEPPGGVPELITLPGRRGFDALNARDANALWILMLLVGILMLVVCANVANLLLARSVTRRREWGVRLALGATRMRLFRQQLIESGVLALLGGSAGLALGYAVARSIHILFQSGRDPSNAFDLHLDPRVLGYTVALSLLTALIFGLAPAMQAARADLGQVLRAQTRSGIDGRLRLPRLLVSIQLALCLAALVSAGLLGRTLGNLKWVEVGFDRDNLAYASLCPSRAGYSAEQVGPYLDRVREELARLPGVVQVSPVATRPLAGGGNNGRVNVRGRVWGDETRANLNAVGDGFFETLHMPLVAGRTFERRDMRPNADAVVVDEAFAKRYFPNQSPLGRHLGLESTNDSQYEIVGVVGNSSYNSLRSEAYPTLYAPYHPGGTIHFAIRSRLDSEHLAKAIRNAVASVDRAVPLAEFHTQSALIDRMLRTERLLGFVSGAFGVVALSLAAIGLGGLLAYSVARRTNEIGIRTALGAAADVVIKMVLRDALGMVGGGILLGLPCAYGVAVVLKAALFRLEPLDLPTMVLSCSMLLGVTLVAALVPGYRAARIDPVTALREE